MTKTYEIGPFSVVADSNSCFFCDHCTDIYYDYENGPYMFICAECQETDKGLSGSCEMFTAEGEGDKKWWPKLK